MITAKQRKPYSRIQLGSRPGLLVSSEVQRESYLSFVWLIMLETKQRSSLRNQTWMPDTVLEASEALWKDIHTYPRLRVTQESMITLRTSMPNNKICLLRYCYVDLKETDSEAGCSTVYLTVRSLCWPGARTMVHSRLWSLFSLASPFFTRISGDTTQTWSKRTSETVTHIQYTLLSVI